MYCRQQKLRVWSLLRKVQKMNGQWWCVKPMHRFFVEPEQISGSTAVIAGDDAHHIQNVLRLHIGEEIILCNGRGTDYRAVIQSMGKEQVRTELLSSEPSGTEPVTKVTLLQALPKASKMETVIQKCVELGMYELIP